MRKNRIWVSKIMEASNAKLRWTKKSRKRSNEETENIGKIED